MPRVPSQKKRPVILASSVAALLSLSFLLSAQQAAADEYWDGTITTGSTITVGSTVPNGKGGDGSWDATTKDWVDATGNNPKVYDPNQLAIFSTIGGSITVGDNLTFTALRFDANDYTISTSGFFTSTGTVATLAPIGTATITATAGHNVTFSVQLVGTGGISVEGPGTVTITDDVALNTYSGGTTLTNGGTLFVNIDQALGTGKLTIAGNGVTIGTSVQTSTQGTTLANPIAITANTFNVTNTGGARDITFNGVIDLTGATRTIVGTVKQEQVHFGTGGIGVAGETAGLTLTTSLTGTGNYVAFITDAGNVNQYTGLTTVTNGAFLVFEGSTADGAVKGDVDIEGNGVVDYLGGNASQIADTSTVTVNSRGNTASGEAFEGFDMFQSSGDTIGVLNGTGTVGLAAANLTVSSGNFSGQITNGLHSGVSLLSAAQGGLIKVGSGTLVLSGANNYVGNTVINGGTLQAGAANTFAKFSGVVLATGGTLDLNNFDQTVGSIADGPSNGIGTIILGTATLTTGRDNTSTTFSGGINGGGGLIKVGAGTLTLAGTSTYTGTTAVNGGTLILAPTTSGTPLLDFHSALSVGGGAFQLTGIASNSTSQTLSGLTITGGNNVIAVNGNLGSSTILDLRGSGGSLGITRNAGVVDFRTTSGTLGVDVEIQTHQGNDSTGILGAWATVNNGAALAFNDGADNIVAYNNYNDIDQTVTLTDNPSSNVRINTDSGGTSNNVINPGTTNLNTLTQNVASNSTVDTSPGTLRMGSVTGVGGIFITPSGGNLTIGTAAGSGNLTAGGGATANGELILENYSSSGTLLINSTVTDNGSGSVSVTVAGSGITALASGSNSYTGTTTILSGTLRTDAAGAIPLTSAVFIDKQGTLDLNNNSQSLSSINDGASGGGTINLGSATLTVGSSNTDTTFSGTIGGTGSLTKVGTGALTLSGTSSSYSGGTTLQSGTLFVNGSPVDGSAAPINGGALTINGGTLGTTLETAIGSSGTTISSHIFVQGDFSIATNVDAANTGAQNITLSGQMDLGSAVRTINGTTPGGTIHLAGLIADNTASTGPGGITFNASGGPAIFSEAGTIANTYTGQTTVNSGVVLNLDRFTTDGSGNEIGSVTVPGNLEIDGTGVVITSAPNQMASTSNVVLGSTGNTVNGVALPGLELANNSQTIGAITGAGTVELGSGTLTITVGSTFDGVISDGSFGTSGNVTFNAPTTAANQTLILNGQSTYTGVTTITNGEIQLGTANALPTVSGLFVDTNGIIDLAGHNQTVGGIFGGGQIQLNGGATLTTGGADFSQVSSFSGVISGDGNLVKVGPQTLQLSGANTYTGTTTVNGGTLDISGSGVSAITVNTGAFLALESGGSINTTATPGQTAVTLGRAATFNTIGTVTASGAGSVGVAMTEASAALVNFSGGTITANTGVTVTNPDGIDTIINAGTITGTGGVAIDARTSAGLSFINTGTINGAVLLGNGNNTVTLVTDSPVPPAITGGSGTDILRLVGGGANTLNLDTVTGFEELDKLGGGLWTLTGTGSFPQGTNINAGTINLLGNLISPVQVETDGLLTGTGTVTGNLTNFGVVAPGLATGGVVFPDTTVGTLTVRGNYNQPGSGVLVIQTGGPNDTDHLTITGHAQLGGTLVVEYVDKGPRLKLGQQIGFLTAGGGVNGKFGDVIVPTLTPTDTLIIPKVVYEGNAVVLEGSQGSFASVDNTVHLTYNQKQVAGALDTASDSKLNRKLLGYLDTKQIADLPAQFDRIAPEAVASVYRIGVSLANVQTNNVQRRTADLRAGATGFSATDFQTNGGGNYTGGLMGANGPGGVEGKTENPPAPEQSRWGSFIKGVGDFAHVGDTGNARGYDMNTGGVTVGADYRLSNRLAVGVTAGYTGTDADLAAGGRVFVNGGKAGVYGTYFDKGFYVDAAVTAGANNYATKRDSVQGEAFGHTQGGEVDMLVDTGYDWRLDGLTIGPTATF